MKPKEAQKIIDCIKGLVDTTLVDAALPAERKQSDNEDAIRIGKEPASAWVAREALYQEFKTRILDDARIDPILLHILTSRPEILVEVEPRIVRLDLSNLRGRVAAVGVKITERELTVV